MCDFFAARSCCSQRILTRAAEGDNASDEPVRSIDGIAKALGGAQVNKQSVLVVGATGTLGRQVSGALHMSCAFHKQWKQSG